MTTQVVIKAMGPQGSGKSIVLTTIARLLRDYGVQANADNSDEHRMTLLLPAGLLDTIEKDSAIRDKRINEEIDARVKAQTKAGEAMKQRDETLAQFAELKQRLHNAELENARLGGYISHVQEREDAERPAQVESRSTPMEPPPAIRRVLQDAVMQRDYGGGVMSAGYGDRHAPRPHWTSYGSR